MIDPYLLDPGYLIVDPIPIRQVATSLVVPTRFNQLALVPGEHNRLELYTIEQGNRRYRLTFKYDPADDRAFLQAWDASFGWEGMHYPVLTRVTEHQQRYLRGTRLQTKTRTEVHREDIPAAQLVSRIVQEFGISPSIVQRALDGTRAMNGAIELVVPLIHMDGCNCVRSQSSLPVQSSTSCRRRWLPPSPANAAFFLVHQHPHVAGHRRVGLFLPTLLGSSLLVERRNLIERIGRRGLDGNLSFCF